MSKAELQAQLGRLVAQMDVAEGLAGAGDVKLVTLSFSTRGVLAEVFPELTLKCVSTEASDD